jgi:hypothetical protein
MPAVCDQVRRELRAGRTFAPARYRGLAVAAQVLNVRSFVGEPTIENAERRARTSRERRSFGMAISRVKECAKHYQTIRLPAPGRF